MPRHRLDRVFLMCVKCGQPIAAIVEAKTDNECPATPNVTGISHLISERKLKALLAAVVP